MTQKYPVKTYKVKKLNNFIIFGILWVNIMAFVTESLDISIKIEAHVMILAHSDSLTRIQNILVCSNDCPLLSLA